MKATDWVEIKRDDSGFLADGVLYMMYTSLPVIVWDSRYESTEYIDKSNWGDWLSHLEGKPYYSHYLPIVLPI